MSGNPIERAKSASIHFALSMAKRPKFADGGPITGPLLGVGGGRTDTLPIAVPAGSYVIPADVVSGLPGAQGNTLEGHNALAKLFNSLPLVPDSAPYGASSPKLAKGKTIPKATGLAGGGHVSHETKHTGEHVDIMAAPGEFVVHPEAVHALGNGDMKLGHEILDELVKEVRKQNIKTLKKLPGPVKK